MDINDWITRLTLPREELGGFSVCPYAKNVKYDLIITDGSDISPPPWDFELIIYVLPEHYTVQEVVDIATEYNSVYSDMVFLPDPKNKNTYINGVQTNNGKYNLILCQWRDSLSVAREKLNRTSYYTYWSEEYLKEIINQ